MRSAPRICILTPGQLGSNPRVVKEASALSEAGYTVTVIATRVLASVEARDRSILDTATWHTLRIPFDNGPRRKVLRLIQEATAVSRRLVGGGPRRDARAYSAMAPALTRAALAVPADLYIAHYVAALPAAAIAARDHGGKFAFDAEDFHAGELRDGRQHERQRSLVAAIEGRYLSACCYVSASSPGIAEAYQATYGLVRPTVVLNAFPRSQAPTTATPRGHGERSASIYWFSQTIGPDRGLECAVQALALARSRPTLHLRGHVAPGFDAYLQRLAAELGVADRLFFLPPALPAQLEALAAEYDLGFSGESPVTRNRSVAIGNKLFSFLLAGVPMVASAIPGHLWLAREIGEAMVTFRPEDPFDLARAIDSYLMNPDRLAAARRHAWHLGQSRYCWDVEKQILLDLVARALDRSRSAAA